MHEETSPQLYDFCDCDFLDFRHSKRAEWELHFLVAGY
jgi:hypothetical protein